MRAHVFLLAALPLALTACDSDDDGLSNAEEAELGTNPDLADSDGDGLSDGDEVNVQNTDPLLADMDGDGFDDGEEIAFGSDPTDWMSYERSEDGRWPDNSAHASDSGSGWAIGSRINNFKGVDQHGEEVRIEQFYGNVILVDFSAGWCGPCRSVAVTAEAMYRSHADDGFLIVHNMIDDNQNGGGITDPSFLSGWADQYGLTFPVINDAEQSAYRGVSQAGIYEGGIPFMVLLDQDLKVVQAVTGGGAEAQLESKAKELLGL